ncbi:diacylglycerol kinase family protein [Bacillus sp. JCM 19034]|uniref:diacylglycerol/lipid kinase family protein n=1 Tax=Bacillus sp. JCM 19034 TaxID=1481928 RepID=UPI001E65CE91|nr:hypothetical protein [Bacillus sp. JCM 19034]
MPLHYKKALLRIFDQRYKRVDLLQLEKRYCLTVTGFGFDGEVAQATNKANYKRWLNQFGLGSLSYVFSMLNVLRSYRPTSIKLRVDKEELSFSDVWLVAVANSPNYAGGVRICPQAVQDDGELNICIVHGLSKWRLLLLFVRAYRGTHINHRSVHLAKGKEVFIQTSEPVSVHSDGETILDRPVHLEIKKGALKVV